uniref:Large ribosomal subunit protein mL40 n=1 Tax=Steinernema glaseri TaxID=37863 RepID=A0A1I7ZXF6_9BILA
MNFLRPLVRGFHTSPVQCGSVFMKRQKKMDPEVAKARETRRRKKLEREIRQMQKHSKKPKPVDEMTVDIQSAKNIHDRIREPYIVPEEVADERIIMLKQYTKTRNQLMRADDAWIRERLESQRKALEKLKALSPALYEAAVQPDKQILPLVLNGPALTPPIENYDSPDGDYIDTTRSWT